MTKMTIYHVIAQSEHPVPVTAQIDLRYPLAGCIHTGRGIWQVIDLETGLSFGRTSDTLKECGPIIAQLYDRVQEIKKESEKLGRMDGAESQSSPEDDRGRQQYQTLQSSRQIWGGIQQMKIKMSPEQFHKIWFASNLPFEFQERIVGEIDMLMYDDDPIDLTDNAANTRRLLADLRYLSAICFREYDELIAYLEDTVATRLHQLKGTRLEIPDVKVNLSSKYEEVSK